MHAEMMTPVVVIAILIACAVGAVMWGITRIVLFIARTLGMILGGPMRRPMTMPPAGLQCPRPNCRAENPPGARFCRRCGEELNHFPMGNRGWRGPIRRRTPWAVRDHR